MSCDLTAGRAELCKDQVGGLRRMYLVNYADITSVTLDSEERVSGITGAATINAFRYELKGQNNLEQTVTTSRDNGTTAVEQTLTAVLKSQNATTHKELKMLSYGRPRVIVEDYNGNYFFMGEEHGVELATMAISTGTTMADLTGYSLTLSAMERTPAPFMDATDEAGLVTLGLTIVS